MKKAIFILLTVALVVSLVPAIAFAKSPKTEFDLNGPHFNLNLVGKADGWNDKEVDNPERHTMFVPMDTSEWEIELGQPNKVIRESAVENDVESLPGFAIFMSQDKNLEDFMVTDGTAFDGDPCELVLPDGMYYVVIAAKGKKNVDPPTIDGWTQVYDELNQLYYYLNLGTVTVSRKWSNATDLFFIDSTEANIPVTGLPDPGDTQVGGDYGGAGTWIFDYLDLLGQVMYDPGDGLTEQYTDLAYFWQLQNNGSKLIQVRFYPMN